MVPAPAGINGVLPISAAAIQKTEGSSNSHRSAGRRAPTARLKVVIRRLAPGLTLDEYESAIGDEWKLGKGKVDWVEYRAGKVSKDLAKPSRPSRVYIHLTDEKHLAALADKIKQCAFTDAKNTSKDAALIGPPVLEFAPYPRIPGGRRRNDARQGTIDQDPDFQLFLESLTSPITKSAAELESSEPKEKVTTTPLIEHIREKKAAKDKPNVKGSASKTSKAKDEVKEVKDAEAATASPEKNRKSAKADKNKTPQEASKTPQRDQASSRQETTTASTPATPNAVNQTAQTTPRSNDRRRERPQMSVAAKIQRDLGLGQPLRRREAAATPPANGSTKAAETAQAGQDTQVSATSGPATASAAASPHRSRQGRSRQSSRPPILTEKQNQPGSVDPSKSNAPASQPTILAKNVALTSTNGPKGQASIAANGPATTKGPATPTPPSSAPTAPRGTSNPTPQAGGRHAFLKHANPSQGVTEPLIQEALAVFGGIERVEIDKRKGFAYVDFADAEGLRKAIAASPIKVAQGAVQVLEKKDRRPNATVMRSPSPMGSPLGSPAGASRGGLGQRGRGGRAASVRVSAVGGSAENVGPVPVAAPAVTTAPAPNSGPAG